MTPIMALKIECIVVALTATSMMLIEPNTSQVWPILFVLQVGGVAGSLLCTRIMRAKPLTDKQER